jgi:hypothetical protein
MRTKNTRLFLTFILIAVLLTACGAKKTPDPNQAVQQIVALTLAALPTETEAPRATPNPTPTPVSLVGLFCEYQFCIGHPPEMSFFDKRAVDNAAVTSSYSDGYLLTLNGTLFIQVIWQYAPGTADPTFLLDTIVDEKFDVENGNKEVKLIRDMNVIYVPITSTATALLPFGGAAAWTCGNRVFAWKAYTPQAEAASPLFQETIDKFTCQDQ